MNDGNPLVDSDGFEWVGEKRAWLHPNQEYELEISFTEVNGLSDVQEIVVSLADNIISDKLAMEWNSTTNQCSSMSHHIVISSCAITDQSGISPTHSSKT